MQYLFQSFHVLLSSVVGELAYGMEAERLCRNCGDKACLKTGHALSLRSAGGVIRSAGDGGFVSVCFNIYHDFRCISIFIMIIFVLMLVCAFWWVGVENLQPFNFNPLISTLYLHKNLKYIEDSTHRAYSR